MELDDGTTLHVPCRNAWHRQCLELMIKHMSAWPRYFCPLCQKPFEDSQLIVRFLCTAWRLPLLWQLIIRILTASLGFFVVSLITLLANRGRYQASNRLPSAQLYLAATAVLFAGSATILALINLLLHICFRKWWSFETGKALMSACLDGQFRLVASLVGGQPLQ